MTTPNVEIRHDVLSREEFVCEKPLLTVDRQMGLNIVRPDGKLPKKISSIIAQDQVTYRNFSRRLKQSLNSESWLLYHNIHIFK